MGKYCLPPFDCLYEVKQTTFWGAQNGLKLKVCSRSLISFSADQHKTAQVPVSPCCDIMAKSEYQRIEVLMLQCLFCVWS